MNFPNFKDKYLNAAIFSPDDSSKYRKETGRDINTGPLDGVIICYSGQLIEFVTNKYPSVSLDSYSGSQICVINNNEKRIGLVSVLGFGAPNTVSITERIINLGVKKFINVGIAGTLQRYINIGDIVVCDKAIRDEGTSYHYVKPAKYSCASKALTHDIKTVLDKHELPYHTGTSWSTDAPYRETVQEVKQYQEEGVLTVDMEASALFAVAEYRNVLMGSIFTISDSLAELHWKPAFQSEKTALGLQTIFSTALETLSGLPAV